jgi:hypothetical protein
VCEKKRVIEGEGDAHADMLDSRTVEGEVHVSTLFKH